MSKEGKPRAPIAPTIKAFTQDREQPFHGAPELQATFLVEVSGQPKAMARELNAYLKTALGADASGLGRVEPLVGEDTVRIFVKKEDVVPQVKSALDVLQQQSQEVYKGRR